MLMMFNGGPTSEDARELVADALVLAEEVADLVGAAPDVASWRIRVGSDVTVQLRHEGLRYVTAWC